MASQTNSPSVLVVEDDAEINALVGAYAQLCGFTYESALDGSTAIHIAHAHHPSLIVLDLMLPDFDGFEVCRRLKADSETRDVPIIMLTAMQGEQCREKGRACGAVDYLTKPFDPDKLMDSIQKHARPDPAVPSSN